MNNPSEPWRVLLVDDDREDYLITRSMLAEAESRAIELEWAASYEAGQKLLQANHYNAALIDYDLGGRTGIELIREIAGRGHETPLILYTGRGGYEVDVQAMQAGATLYLTKSEANPLLLERSLRYAIERRRIEKELAEALTRAENEQRRLQAVMAALPVGVAITDREGGVIQTNQTYEQVWGGPRPETQSVGDYVSYKATWIETGETVAPEEWASAQAVLKGQAVVGQQMEVQRFDGSRVVVINSAAPVLDSNGEIVGSAVAIQDITNVFEAEQALRSANETLQEQAVALEVQAEELRLQADELSSANELLRSSEHRFRSFVEAYPYGLAIYDARGRYVYVNEPWRQITGLSGEQIAGRADPELFPNRATRAHLFELHQAIQTGQAQRFEWALPPEVGGRTVTVTYTPVKDPSGYVHEVLATLYDITEQKQAEEALRRNEKLLVEYLESTSDLFFSLDHENRLIYANRRFCEITGLDQAEITGKNFLALFPKYVGTTVEANFRKAMEERTPVHFPAEGIYIGRWYEVSVYPTQRGISIFIKDRTEAHQAEQALREYARKLEQSNQALKDFAFIASHDLKEPLRKIQTFGDLLLSDYGPSLDEEGQGYIQRMNSAAGRMQRMLDGLLEYSRLPSQGQPFEPVELAGLVSSVLSDLEVRIKESAGQVEVGELAVIEGDRLQIRQLLQNLIGNALKFHRPGVPPLVRVYCQSASDGRTELVVEDNGIGFDMDRMNLLFQPFNRLVGRSEYEGSGMGLAICRKIVERHGGEISARGEPGKGAAFTVTLPVQHSHR